MRPNQILAEVTSIAEGSHRPADGVAGGHVTRLIADREPGLALLGGTAGPGLGCDAFLKLFLESIVAHRGCRIGTVGDISAKPAATITLVIDLRCVEIGLFVELHSPAST